MRHYFREWHHFGAFPERNNVMRFSDCENCCSWSDNCERSRPGLNQLDYWHDSQRPPLQDEDHSGNDPRSNPGFLR